MPRQIILILAETQSARLLGCHEGNSALRTPNLDQLASEGLLFEKACTCSPVCGPARSAIFTGLYPHSNGVIGNDMSPHLDVPTVGERLTQAAITAGYIGKWHLDGTDYFGDGRCPAGWDPAFWFDGRNYLESIKDEKLRDSTRLELTPQQVRELAITSEFTFIRQIGNRAGQFLEQNQKRDFLLVIAPDEPHHPFICPEPFVSGFEDVRLPIPNADDPLTEKPLMQREWAAHCAPAADRLLERHDGKAFLKHSRYLACNSFLDDEIGRILAKIKELTPDALVIYTSDHGDMFGAHRLYGKGPAMYEEICNVPFLIRWPGVTAPGVRNSAPLSQIGITPTILDYFGLEIPRLIQGTSLLERFRNPSSSAEETVFIEFNRFEIDHDGFGAFAPVRTAYDGRWKLAVNLLDTDEFYDLATDPCELLNRIGDPACQKDRERLHDQLLNWMDTTRDPLRGPHWRRRQWRILDCSSWGGATRPRPFDLANYPPTLLYSTGHVADQSVYAKD